jgi:CO dehydrogenase maturation factor
LRELKQPGSRSIETAFAVRALVGDLGISACHPVLVGARDDTDRARVQSALGDWPLLAVLPWDDAIRAADLDGRPPPVSDTARAALRQIVAAIAPRLTLTVGAA